MKFNKIVSVLPALAWCFMHGALFAQPQPAAEDRVFLKTGAEYSGIIVEQRPGESIRLWRTAESDTLQFDMESIDRITRVAAVATPAQPPVPVEPVRRFNTSPWKLAFQGGTGGGDYPVAVLGASMYRYFPEKHVWLGLGAHYLGDQSSFGSQSIPIFLHGSYELTGGWKDRFAGAVFAEAGYSINLNTNYFDDNTQAVLQYGNGWHAFGGLRLRLNVLRNLGIWADLGYLRHTSSLRYESSGERVRAKGWNIFLVRGSVFF